MSRSYTNQSLRPSSFCMADLCRILLCHLVHHKLRKCHSCIRIILHQDHKIHRWCMLILSKIHHRSRIYSRLAEGLRNLSFHNELNLKDLLIHCRMSSSCQASLQMFLHRRRLCLHMGIHTSLSLLSTVVLEMGCWMEISIEFWSCLTIMSRLQSISSSIMIYR